MTIFAFGIGLVLGLVLGAAFMMFAGFRTDPVPDEPPEPPMGVGA